MNSTIDKRLAALEAAQGVKEPITIIRIITLPGDVDAEPDRAEVGGATIYRADDEAGEAFLARVRAAAALAAKPGCVRVALVLPRVPTEQRDRP